MAETRLYLADAAPLADAALFRDLYLRATPARRAKVDGYRFPKDKRLSLAAGALLRHALAEAGVLDPAFTRGPQGKPMLAGRNDVHFNLSHAGQRVLCAVSDQPVGCDVEQITDIELEVARRFFTSAEYACILAEAEPEGQQRMFFRLWTLKESFMKATGLGMALPLDAFSVDPAARPVTVKQKVCTGDWHFQEYDPGDRYLCAVCGRTPRVTGVKTVPLR